MKSSSVTYLNNQVKAYLETTFVGVYLHGEISNLVNHQSGHSYFVLKDEYSSIKCVLFKGNKRNITVELKNGQKVEAKGAITVYSPRGEYQIICHSIELFGQGDLYARHEQLKKELLAKGYFDESRKKPLKKFPEHIVLITSKTGAVIQDMQNIASKRWSLTRLELINTVVQGTSAVASICEAIAKAHTLKPDVIVLARGGGSIEDLWAFNEERVAEAIFAASIPIVSAIGHESDYLISDMVADKRASTPSNAMEILLPDVNEQIQYIDDLKTQMNTALKKIFSYKNMQINELKKQSKGYILQNKISARQTQITQMAYTYQKRCESILSAKQQSLPNIRHLYANIVFTKFQNIHQKIDNYKKLFEQYNPDKLPSSGKAKILKDNHQASLKDIQINDVFSLKDTKYSIEAKAIKKTSTTA